MGAQAQRILAVYGVAKHLRLKYIHTEISELAIHPLDPYQSKKDMQIYLQKVNFVFAFPSDLPPKSALTVTKSSLSLIVLLVSILKSAAYRREVVVRCVEPYRIVDKFPRIYEYAKRDILNFYSYVESLVLDSAVKRAAIHYRQGVGGMVIQDGEKYPREIPPEYFIRELDRHLTHQNLILVFHLCNFVS